MVSICFRSPRLGLQKTATLCLVKLCVLLCWCSLPSSAGAESANAAQIPPNQTSPQDPADLELQDASPQRDEPIVVDLDIPPGLATFLAEQEAANTQADVEAPAAAETQPALVVQEPLEPAQPEPEDPLQNLPFKACFTEAASAYDLEESLLIGIAIVESSLDPDAVSKADAVGLMQIKWPITANHLGIQDRQELFDPCLNIDAGARYLRELLDDLSNFGPQPRLRLALASYRLGPSGFDPNVPLPATAEDYIKQVQAQRQSLATPSVDATTVNVSGPVLPCLIQGLRQMTAVTHDPSQRNAAFAGWLNARGQGCSTLALIQIRNNMPTWLGTSLTPELEDQVRALLDTSIQRP